MRNKCFLIDGGAGRIITAIPALEKYARLNPGKDFYVIIGGWEFLLWGNHTLQDRVFSMDTKGVFENYIRHCDVVTPEPYKNWHYFNQKCSLIEAFDKEINLTDDHSDLEFPNLFLTRDELATANITLDEVKQAQQKKTTIIFQPFGSGARVKNNDIIDTSNRSLDVPTYLELIRRLSNKFNLVFFGTPDMRPPDDEVTAWYDIDLRGWAAMVKQAEYFVGVDSVGQHIARAVGTPGTVIMGGTDTVNSTYPDFFKVFENKNFSMKYVPWRMCNLDVALADKYNDGCMQLSSEQVDEIYNMIVSDIQKNINQSK